MPPLSHAGAHAQVSHAGPGVSGRWEVAEGAARALAAEQADAGTCLLWPLVSLSADVLATATLQPLMCACTLHGSPGLCPEI